MKFFSTAVATMAFLPSVAARPIVTVPTAFPSSAPSLSLAPSIGSCASVTNEDDCKVFHNVGNYEACEWRKVPGCNFKCVLVTDDDKCTAETNEVACNGVNDGGALKGEDGACEWQDDKCVWLKDEDKCASAENENKCKEVDNLAADSNRCKWRNGKCDLDATDKSKCAAEKDESGCKGVNLNEKENELSTYNYCSWQNKECVLVREMTTCTEQSTKKECDEASTRIPNRSSRTCEFHENKCKWVEKCDNYKTKAVCNDIHYCVFLTKGKNNVRHGKANRCKPADTVTCSNADLREESCNKLKNCFWDKNSCEPSPYTIDCAKQKKEDSCRSIGCTWIKGLEGKQCINSNEAAVFTEIYESKMNMFEAKKHIRYLLPNYSIKITERRLDVNQNLITLPVDNVNEDAIVVGIPYYDFIEDRKLDDCLEKN